MTLADGSPLHRSRAGRGGGSLLLSLPAGLALGLLLPGCSPGEKSLPPMPPPVQARPAQRPVSPRLEAIYQAALSQGNEDLQAGRFSDAVMEFSKAMGVHPDNPVLLRVLGTAHARNNDLTRARRSLEASIRLDPRVPGAHYELAQVALAGGDLDTAEQEARRTVLLDPDNPTAHELVGVVEYRQGRVETALTTLEPVAARDPTRVQTQFILGLCYQHLKEYQKARDAFQKAVRNDPRHREAYFNLGKVLAILGDEEGARRANAEFLRLQNE
ncbi:MAG: tetratricopeptide repeat protein [Acidobacteriota bacterium]